MSFGQLLLIIFGWLLGLLSPAITEKIRKSYRRKELVLAICAELHELQCKMALVSHELNKRLATVTNECLNRLELVVKNYSGPHDMEGIARALTAYRNMPEEIRCGALARMKNPDVGITLMQYSIPFITSHLADISLYPIPFQSAVIAIKDQMDMFNQRVANQQKLYDRTFATSLSDFNRSATLTDLAAGNRFLADQAGFIVDLIFALPI